MDAGRLGAYDSPHGESNFVIWGTKNFLEACDGAPGVMFLFDESHINYIKVELE